MSCSTHVLATIRHVLLFKKLSLDDLSQNVSAEFGFIKIVAVVMIVGVMTDFEITFTCNLFKLLGKIMILFSKFHYLKTKLVIVLS